MKLMKIILSIIMLLGMSNLAAQKELNSYKYIIVPKKFSFLKKENQYRVNSYTKFLFDKEGYQVFYDDDDLPQDLKSNPCLGLTANVIDASSTFTTKLFLVLENCGRDEIFKSVEGRSKIKEYDRTYIDALKKCFVSVQELEYEYEPYAPEKVTEEVQKEELTDDVETAAVAAVAVKEKEEENTIENNTADADNTKAPSSNSAENAAAPVAVVAAPVVVSETEKAEEVIEDENSTPVARAFDNGTVSFLLVDRGPQLQAFVSQSKNEKYKPGQLIGTFQKSSLPNVYRVSWHKPEDGVDETTAYFDDKGDLKIDVQRNGKLETLTFVEIK